MSRSDVGTADLPGSIRILQGDIKKRQQNEIPTENEIPRRGDYANADLTLSTGIRGGAAALESPDIAQRLAVQGLCPVRSCGADFAATIRRQYDDYGRIIREANITLQ